VDRKQASQVTAGLLLVALGLLFLGQRLNLISGLDISRMWPLILIVVGVGKFFGPRADGEPRGGVWLMFLGSLFLAHTFRVLTLDRSWPLFIVAGGVSILIGSYGKSMTTKHTPTGTPGGN
jgi:Domain of unknown function (DUF5668)